MPVGKATTPSQGQLDEVLNLHPAGTRYLESFSKSGPSRVRSIDCTRRPAPFELGLPEAKKDYVSGKSSRGKKVHIPTWITLGGIRFNKLALFPNTQNDISEHAGAHGCVAAYEVSASCRHLLNDVKDLPALIALKCVPFGPKRKVNGSPWASEWRIHHYLRNSSSAQAYWENNIDKTGHVACLGGASTTISRSCQVFFALELMDTDLFTMIERSASIPNFGNWIIRALYSTCQALDKIHKSGMIYCDLKPENVLVRIKDAHAKFGDFDRSCIPSLNVGVVGGTKGYYSPERMRNSSLHTLADDVWAFGVLILIGATTAASPYLDYTVETIHKFVPSKYLARYCRCGWSPTVINRVGMLCDKILHVDKDHRAPLDLALDTLGQLVIELDSIEQASQSQFLPGYIVYSVPNATVSHNPELQAMRREPHVIVIDDESEDDEEEEPLSPQHQPGFVSPYNYTLTTCYPSTQLVGYDVLSQQPQIANHPVHAQASFVLHQPQQQLPVTFPINTPPQALQCGLDESDIQQPITSAMSFISNGSSGLPIPIASSPSSSSSSMHSAPGIYTNQWNGVRQSGPLSLSCSSASSRISYTSSTGATTVFSPKLSGSQVHSSGVYLPQVAPTHPTMFSSPMTYSCPQQVVCAPYVSSLDSALPYVHQAPLPSASSSSTSVYSGLKRHRSLGVFDDTMAYMEPAKRQIVQY